MFLNNFLNIMLDYLILKQPIRTRIAMNFHLVYIKAFLFVGCINYWFSLNWLEINF